MQLLFLPLRRFFYALLPVACCLAFLLPVACCLLPVSYAQSTNAAVGGQITDEQGRVVPGVTVVLTNLNTGITYEAKTNGDGIYNAPNLPPGIYRANVAKDGFKSIVKGDIELHVQDVASINFQLQIGSVTETVTVQAGGMVINTTDATVATVIDRNFAENLPLNGRSFQTLILLSPGTVLTTVGNNGGTFSVNGQRTNSNNFTVDGVSANLGSSLNQSNPGQLNGSNPSFTVAGTTQGMVSVDALQEFKIQTSSYGAEFGRQPGGQVSLLTRSGTNAFHGTAFDYLRNDLFDANNWFNDQQKLPKATERQNDFGGTFGGPIFKNKTFFFFSYEGLRLFQPHTQVTTVPSLRLRQEAAPAYQAILNSWPIPTAAESVDSNGNPTGGTQYTLSVSQPTDLDSYSIKVDHTLGNIVHLFGRFSGTNSDLGFIAPNLISIQHVNQRALTIGTDLSVRPNLQNELRLNYAINSNTQHNDLHLIGGGKPFDTSVLRPAPLAPGDSPDLQFILPEAFFDVQPGPLGEFSQRQINVTDSLLYSVRTHQLKMGIDYRRLFPIYAQLPVGGIERVSSEADLIASVTSRARLVSQLPVHPIYSNFSAYVQDSWKSTNRLTLTYGVRWEWNPPPGERDGIFPPNVIGFSNPPTATLAPVGSAYKTTYNNFAPRVGVAYQARRSPSRQTVVRGGFGVFYDLNSETAAVGFQNFPFSVSGQTVSMLPGTSKPLPFPVPNGVLVIPPVPAPLVPPFNRSGIAAIDPNLQLPYTLQWNLSVEQALGFNQSLTVSYVASGGYRLLRSDNLFDFNSNFASVAVLRNASSSNYESLQLQFNRRLSNGLQALASYTYSHSIDNASAGQDALSASQTGASFLNPSVDRGNSSFDLRHAFRAAITYNVPTLNAKFLSKAVLGGWSLDTIAIAQTGAPVDLVGGQYFPSALPDAFFQLRPNVTPGIPLYLSGAQCAAANGGVPCPGGKAINFTPGVVVGGCPDGSQSVGPFCPVPTDANGNPTQLQGTLGRNVLRDLGAWQIDFALHRQFDLTERFHLQFRSEFFNVLNHPNFGPPQSFVPCGSGCFGLANQTLNNNLGGLSSLYQIGGPRSIQLALKLAF
jgi:hypothetical protein